MNEVFIKDNKLIIEVPLTQERNDLYNDTKWEGENIIGIIEPLSNCNVPDIGFAYRIDMSYKGKGDQWTDIFYKWHDTEESFISFCNDHSIEVYEYSQCSKCKRSILGCYTFSNDGKKICMDCADKLKA